MAHADELRTPLSKHSTSTVEVAGYEPVDGESVPRRNVHFKDQLISKPEDSINTIFDIVKRASNKFGSARCLGWRDLINTHKEIKKVKKLVDGKEQMVDKEWTYFELGEYKYINYLEYEKLTLELGAGLRKLGLAKGDRLHLYAGTSYRWLAMMHGGASQSISGVTSYETLGEEGLKHSMVATKAKAIFIDSSLLRSLRRPIKDARDIQFVIYNSAGHPDDGGIDELKDENPHITFLSFEDFRKLGEENPTDPVPPNPEDLCCIMYTSGSTGPPKGVQLTHRNVVAAVAGVNAVVETYVGEQDNMLAYLPLAHIFEFMFENASLYWGCTLGYASSRTMVDTSMRNCKGDLREFKPTLMVGVPAVWETVRKGIISKVEEAGFVSRKLFWSGLQLKRQLINRGIPGSRILDSVIFKKVSQATGGRLRFCMSGAGPIAAETREFLSLVVCPMLIGYGLTETTAMTSIGDPWAWPNETLGNIPPCIEVKLVDFPEAGYITSSKPQQGEVWVRGHAVMECYYDNEGMTKEVMTPDGWFKTGDIGEWDEDGNLKVIDRKKSLVKTLNGEYIAIEKLESLYQSVSAISQICIYASPSRAKPVAIVVPAESALKKLARDNGVECDTLEELVHNDQLNRAILRDIQAVARKNSLANIEIPQAVVLVDEPWTPQNGFTTAAMKLNRRGIKEKYESDIDKAYQQKS
ncbi:hypothetical protein AJ80_02371 [Polytolypa hystricis UAMH7299]|uniref:AMP-dependent synthetase/ligase domain-containing protein n=1 Tax=Polytolypa hystricis (strain UAMH7299) TaxID=1447883 RepID=A0A2B7YRA1_POLH7|nr:hypothetical protein AJ80_02371 [Polytolypa hystricis UAMH7299]